MTKDTLIKKTLQSLSNLPEERVREISDFADYILKKYDEEVLQQGIERLVSKSEYFDLLKNEEDLYTVEDLKEKYK